ncbi:hypothetical protein MP228_002614 [Amoeboaphelidium protococcarum]|nr:hypothetical protein MP228_002614 [Amoeboaphelidium protococcarum]
MQQYRPEKVLSVSDLIKPLYCEVQHEYELRTGQRIETEQMKQGTEFHLKLELEVHDIVQIDVDTLEDKWAIRLLNLQLAIQMLLSTGRAREVPVFGYVDNDAILVRGVIDELRMDEDSQTIIIIDHKTRTSNYLPSESQVNQTKFQLMMYKLLLVQLIRNAHDLANGFKIHSNFGKVCVDRKESVTKIAGSVNRVRTRISAGGVKYNIYSIYRGKIDIIVRTDDVDQSNRLEDMELQLTEAQQEQLQLQEQHDILEEALNLSSAAQQEPIAEQVHFQPTPVDPVAILKLVQARCADQPDYYPQLVEHLNDLSKDYTKLKDFLDHCVDLLQNYPDLVMQLNQFLPEGYAVLYDPQSQDSAFNIVQPAEVASAEMIQHAIQPLIDSITAEEVMRPLGSQFEPSLGDAKAFLQLVKARVENPKIYDDFMDAMEEHRRSRSKKKTRKLKNKVVNLLNDYPDLLFVMRLFLPEEEQISVEASSLSLVQYSPLLPLYARFVQEVFVPIPAITGLLHSELMNAATDLQNSNVADLLEVHTTDNQNEQQEDVAPAVGQ